MSRVSIAAAPEAVEVDLWGALFYTQRVTRTRQKALAELEAKARELDESENTDTDTLVELYGQILDQLLEPETGKRKKASAHITERWKADDLTIPELEDFIERLGEANRPT
jgi:hypothetical protein